MKRALFAVLVAGIVATTGVSAANAVVSIPVAAPIVHAGAYAPCSVDGYTDHALYRMQRRQITKQMVESTVAMMCVNGAMYQPHGTWYYDDGCLTVIVSRNGWVVTTFWTASGDND